MARRSRDLTEPPADPDLMVRARRGDAAAFEELYRRHSASAWRVAYAVTGNPHDASDAVSEAFTRVFAALPAGRFPPEAPFRPYLLTATRNAAIDGIRRSGKLQPTDIEELHIETAASTPSDSVIGALDSSLVATAFLSLPERWRSVLWLTEVEGLQPREIAEMLGVTPNGAAQLAVRARNGLREQFLQAHLRAAVKTDCRFTVDHLGAYVGGALSARDVAKVDQHLTGCDACRARQQELEDIGSTLRKIVLPIPIGLGAVAAARWKLIASTLADNAHRGWRTGAGVVRAVRPLAVASGLMLALGIIGAAIVQPPSGTQLTTPSRRAPNEAGRPTPVVQGFAVAPPIAASAIESVNDVARQQAARSARLAAPPAPPTNNGAGPAPSRGGGGGNTPSPPPPKPVLQLAARTTPASSGAAVGDACTGVDLAGTVIGCAPPAAAPTAALVTVKTQGQLLGDNTIAI